MLHDIAPLKTHNIDTLLQSCINISQDFEKLRGIEYLTDYAVSLGYPDNFYIPDYEETKEALILANKVRDFVLNKIEFTNE